MNDLAHKIGVIRQHRWMSAEEQAARLVTRCRYVVSLGGGTVKRISREDLEKLARPGAVIEMVHAFLLAEPSRKRTAGGLRADFRKALARLEKRGAELVDADTGISSKTHRRALLALVDSDLGRSNRGARSATNGAKSKGRERANFTKAQCEAAYNIWHNRKSHPRWLDVDVALAKIVSPNGYTFTRYRAHKKWGGRT